jgi:hypothetical protein
VAAIESRDLNAFRAALPAADAVRDAAVIEGFNYSNGQPVAIHLFLKTGTPGR